MDIKTSELRSIGYKQNIIDIAIKEYRKHKYLYLMVLPGILLVFIFNYVPMYGILLAFKNYKVNLGISGSPWVGFKYFTQFFSNPLAVRTIRNTLILGALYLVWSFPAPIILSFLFNELRSSKLRKIAQTISCYPHFVSMVIIVGLWLGFSSRDGLFNDIRGIFNLETLQFWTEPQFFRTLFISSGIWQYVGFGTIIYLAALSGVDVELYNVATIDGVNRFQKIVHVSWPHIKPTVIILFILAIGRIFAADTQKVLLMYSAQNYETSDIIGTYVFREGILGARFEYTTAVGLFQTAINFTFLIGANYLSKKIMKESLF